MIASPNAWGWRWLKGRLSVLLFAFAFLGSAVGSTLVRDAEETAEHEADTSDAIVSSKRSRARSGERVRTGHPALSRCAPRDRVDSGRGAEPASPVARAKRAVSHIGLPRRVPPDDAGDDVAATA